MNFIFLRNLQEIKLSDLPKRYVPGRSYGSQKDKRFDDETEDGMVMDSTAEFDADTGEFDVTEEEAEPEDVDEDVLAWLADMSADDGSEDSVETSDGSMDMDESDDGDSAGGEDSDDARSGDDEDADAEADADSGE